MKNFAKEYHAKRKGNCAQAVAAAWGKAHGQGPEIAEEFSGLGGGRAENGICGAIYAAGKLLPEEKEALYSRFQEKAGSIFCKEIRSQKRFSCSNCVETAADLLNDFKK